MGRCSSNPVARCRFLRRYAAISSPSTYRGGPWKILLFACAEFGEISALVVTVVVAPKKVVELHLNEYYTLSCLALGSGSGNFPNGRWDILRHIDFSFVCRIQGTMLVSRGELGAFVRC